MAPQHSSSETNRPARSRTGPVPKLCGADVELGNVVRGINGLQNTGRAASRAILSEIVGVPHSRWANAGWNSTAYNYNHVYTTANGAWGSGGGTKASQFSQAKSYDYDSQDWGRKFLPSNGGCVYIDLNHLELCIPEVRSASDFVAAWHAMLLVAREAMDRANANTRQGRRIQVLVNNSDGQGNSYGSHLNFLLSRRAWDNIFHRKPHHIAYLASYQVSSIVITGQGKVGAENNAPAVPYQLSQRADFFEKMSGTQTTFDRPLVNSRDEALCGTQTYIAHAGWSQPDFARLHCIFYDSNLCHVACLLKVGVMQIVLAMLEADCVNPELILDDPLEAVVRFSHDPSLQARARMASGKNLTAVELQLLFLDEAQNFCARGGCDQVVPDAGEILALYADTLQKLHQGDLDAVAGRLDWVLKLRILERAMAQRPALSWDSPELKLLDHLYSSLDPNEGLYGLYEQAGATEHVASAAQIERFIHEPPEDTRAFSRAMLLRLVEPGQIDHVDWDSMRFRLANRSGWPIYRTLEMADPLGFTKADTAALFESAAPVEDILDALMSDASVGNVSHEVLWVPDSQSRGELLLLPAPDLPPTDSDSPISNSDLITEATEEFHEPEGEQDDPITTTS